MNILKTPHEKLLEEAGMAPPSPGMLNTPRQLLAQEINIVPKFAEGGSAQMSPDDMRAMIFAHAMHYAKGGATEDVTFNIGKNIGEKLNALSDAEIKKRLLESGYKISDYKVVPPRPESKFGPFEHTAVVTAKGNPQNLSDKTWAIAKALGQEAIPAQSGSQSILAGPATHNWQGKFDPNYFVPQHGVQAAGNVASRTDKAKELINKAKLFAKHHPFQSAFNALNFSDVIGNAYDTVQNLRQSKPVQALESGFNAIAAIPAALPSVPAAVSLAVPIAGQQLTESSAQFAAEHPEYTSQMRDVASSPLGGALSGDAGLASYILGDRDYTDVIKKRQPE